MNTTQLTKIITLALYGYGCHLKDVKLSFEQPESKCKNTAYDSAKQKGNDLRGQFANPCKQGNGTNNYEDNDTYPEKRILSHPYSSIIFGIHILSNQCRNFFNNLS